MSRLGARMRNSYQKDPPIQLSTVANYLFTLSSQICSERTRSDVDGSPALNRFCE